MTIQEVAAFWDERPCNIRHGTIPIEEDPFKYSRQVTQRKLRVEPHIRWHLSAWEWEGKRVLDMGCGIGTQTLMLARYGAYVTGIDLSKRSLDIARARRAAELIERSPIFLDGNIQDTDLIAPGSCDMVYSFGVIHHTPDPMACFQNAYRWLKPGGEFRFMVYNRYSWKAFWILATYGKLQFWKWGDLIQEHSEAQLKCPITRTYTQRSISRIMNSIGFTILDMRVDHIFPYSIPEYVKHRYVKEWYWKILPNWLFRWLEQRIGWHLLVIARRPK